MLELAPNGGVYNSCPLVGPRGVVGCYRKIHLPFLELIASRHLGESRMQRLMQMN